MAKPLKLLIENESNLGPVFDLDEKRYADAEARHPDVAKQVEAVFSYDLSNYAKTIGEADAVVGWTFPHREIKSAASRLKWIHLTGAGVNHMLPFDWVPPGVVITNNRGVHAPKAQEFAAMAALMLANRIPDIVGLQQQKAWKSLYSPTISGKTALIVGVGNMGGAAAAACQMLGMCVLGMRRSGEPHPAVDAMYKPEALIGLLAQADIVFVCTPLTPDTKHLLGEKEIAAMKPGAGLVNIGRGSVVDTEALRTALIEKKLGGAIVDVFDPEPLPADSPLWHTPNLIVTPHCSSDDADTYVPRTLDLVFENMRRLIAGWELTCRVDPKRGY